MTSAPSRILRRLLAPKPADLQAAPHSAAVHPDAAPYEGGDGSAGVLVLHGFSGSPKSMHPWAMHLEAAGFAVSLPRLPGHGTTWEELNRTGWTDWYDEAEHAFRKLSERCDQVFLAGLSMGGALALRLAQQHGPRVSGLTLVNPVISSSDPRVRLLPVLHRLLPSLPGIANDIAKPGVDECGYARTPLSALHSGTHLWAAIQADLGDVDQPLLVYRSIQDHVGDPSSVRLISSGVRSADQAYVELPRSYHVATLDYEADTIFAGSVEFYRRLTKD